MAHLKKAVKISIVEGIFAQVYATLTTVGSVFITKFATILGATSFQFSLLSAISQLSQIFQPIAVILTKHTTSRKKKTITFAFWGRFLSFFFGFWEVIG